MPGCRPDAPEARCGIGFMPLPMFVHCCHSAWCRRETEPAFAINPIIEMDRMKGAAAGCLGQGPEMLRCPECRGGWQPSCRGRRLAGLVRVGPPDRPAGCPHQVHIHTATKLPWGGSGRAGARV